MIARLVLQVFSRSVVRLGFRVYSHVSFYVLARSYFIYQGIYALFSAIFVVVVLLKSHGL